MSHYSPSLQAANADKPYLNPSLRTRTLCIAGLIFSVIAGIVCLGLGIHLVLIRGSYLHLNKYVKELLPLALNTLVTICNETLGYIHTVSLRWALQREGRLTFNSNLRLFTSARTSRVNKWYANLWMVACIVFTYASTSLIFMGDVGSKSEDGSLLPEGKTTFVCGYAVITLSIGILGQTGVAVACLLNKVVVPSWSPNVLDTAAACVTAGSLVPEPGRCLCSVHDGQHDGKVSADRGAMETSSPVMPRRKQRPAYKAHKEVRYVFFSLWTTVGLTLLWGGVLIAVIRSHRLVDGMYYGDNWSFFPVLLDSVRLGVSEQDQTGDTHSTMTLTIPWQVIGQFEWQNTLPYVSFASFAWAFALVCLLQAIMTLSLHCAELLVNLVRDEKTWRRAGTDDGLPRRSSNAILVLFSSPPGLLLFAWKPILHWLYSLAVSSYFSVGLLLRPPQIFYLAIGAVALAAFASGCAFWRPNGAQPATFGHLQTIVNLVDEWPQEAETMFWGRKTGSSPMTYANSVPEIVVGDVPFKGGPTDFELQEQRLLGDQSVGHAGTSGMRLEEVRSNEVYMGCI